MHGHAGNRVDILLARKHWAGQAICVPLRCMAIEAAFFALNALGRRQLFTLHCEASQQQGRGLSTLVVVRDAPVRVGRCVVCRRSRTTRTATFIPTLQQPAVSAPPQAARPPQSTTRTRLVAVCRQASQASVRCSSICPTLRNRTPDMSRQLVWLGVAPPADLVGNFVVNESLHQLLASLLSGTFGSPLFIIPMR
jgi:hypothetical protein